MDIESYMDDVKSRLAAAAGHRDTARTAALAPLAPLRDRINTAKEELRGTLAQIRTEKTAALAEAKKVAKNRREEASRQAARIYEDAQRQMKQIRSQAKEENAADEERIAKEYVTKAQDQTAPLKEAIGEMESEHDAGMEAVASELGASEDEYRKEYEKVLSERIITRKALTAMGFDAPPRGKKKQNPR